MSAADVTVLPSSIVYVHTLRFRPEGDSWVTGRPDTGNFVIVPGIARQVITLLSAGKSVEDVCSAIEAETGVRVDVAEFVRDLASLGFIDAVDRKPIEQPPPPPCSLPWIKPRHVSWVVHPGAPYAAAAIIISAVACIVTDPGSRPHFQDLLWPRWPGAGLLCDVGICWALLCIHEFAHLVTARGAGVSARTSFSTRLQFLVAQTDVSGVWILPRRARLTVYLAGITTDLLSAAAGVIFLAAVSPVGLARSLIEAIVLLASLSVGIQLFVFTRTDFYFVIQDISKCANLYASGIAYSRYLAMTAMRFMRKRITTLSDQTSALPRRERWTVRIYGTLLPIATAAFLLAWVIADARIVVFLFRHAANEITAQSGGWRVLDGMTVFAAVLGAELMWGYAWWRNHGAALIRFARRRHSAPGK